MFEDWHVFSRKNQKDLPKEGEEVFFCIAESHQGPFTVVKRMKTDQQALHDLLNLHPSWSVFWQPLPASIPAPSPALLCRLEG